MNETTDPATPLVLTEDQRQLLYHLHRNLKGSFLQFDKLCRDLNIVTNTKGYTP